MEWWNDEMRKWMLEISGNARMTGNGCIWVEWLGMANTGWKLLKLDGIAGNGLKWLTMAGTAGNYWRSLKWLEIVEIAGNSCKRLEMARNSRKLLEWLKVTWNCWELLEKAMAKHGWYGYTWLEMAILTQKRFENTFGFVSGWFHMKAQRKTCQLCFGFLTNKVKIFWYFSNKNVFF